MTTVGDDLFEAIEPVLPASDLRVWGDAVFEDTKLAAGLDHPTQFSQGGLGVGNRAERERDDGRVE